MVVVTWGRQRVHSRVGVFAFETLTCSGDRAL